VAERRSYASGCLAIERTMAPGGAIICFLNVFDTLDKVLANERGANIRFLSSYNLIEEGSMNDRPKRYDRSLPQ
jgi:hypothetical protein